MSLVDWFSRNWQNQAHHCVFAPIPAGRIDAISAVEQIPVVAEKHYVRIWLAEMFLEDDHRLFQEFVPVVHSAVRLQFGRNAGQEIPYIAGPQNVGLGNTLGKGVQLNHPLTNLLPYRGGSISIAAGLFAYKRRDLLDGFIGMLHDISGLFNSGQLSLVLGVADKALKGIESFMECGDKEAHLIYFEGFGGATKKGGSGLTSGYRAIINTSADQLDPDHLFIKNKQLHFGQDLASAKPLTGYDYMLLRIEADSERDDYGSFAEFAKLLEEAIKEGVRDPKAGESIIESARIAAYCCQDLTQVDRARVSRALVSQYRNAMAGSLDLTSGALEELGDALMAEVKVMAAEPEDELSLSLTADEIPSLQEFLRATRE